jgi:hypothetical protein
MIDAQLERDRLRAELEAAQRELKRFEVGEHRWVTCPVCDETDALAYFEGDKNDPTGHGWLVHCSNLACPSNISVHAAENRKLNTREARVNTIREVAEAVGALSTFDQESERIMFATKFRKLVLNALQSLAEQKEGEDDHRNPAS